MGPKLISSFYRRAENCRACVRIAAGHHGGGGLEEKVAAHRSERERKLLLRAELKKIALQGRKNRKEGQKKAARVSAVRKLIPTVDAEVPDVTPEQKELAKRVLARRRLIEFVKLNHSRYRAGWVHHDICRRLEQFSQDVADEKSPRLMLLMPPRHGKSLIASQNFPAWHLGKYPWHEFIGCSYNIDLARGFSRKIRTILRSPRYGQLFPNVRLDPESQSAEAWALLPEKGGVDAGGYVAAGVGGGITGKGAHILAIDDPIKNAEEADSVDIREKLWDWYASTAYTRLAPGGGILIIQTCWSDDDLAGRIQDAMKNDPEFDQFVIVKYPAIAEEDEEFRAIGEPLHPDRFTLAQLLQIKKNMDLKGSRWWSALYQQNPVPAEGAFFKKEHLIYRNELPQMRDMYIYQAWDTAISEKRYGDFTVGATLGVDSNDNVHILKINRFKSGDTDVIIRAILDDFEAFPNVRALGIEDGQIWKTLKTAFDKECIKRKLYPAIVACMPITDKTVRAGPLQGRFQQKKVTLPYQADWLEDARRELLRFPAGAHDDIIDALAWGVLVLLGKGAPPPPRPPKNRREKTVAEKIRGLGTTSGRSHMSA